MHFFSAHTHPFVLIFILTNSIHVMAGVVSAGKEPTEYHRTFIHNLSTACEVLEAKGLTACIEAISPVAVPDYFLNSIPQALQVVQEVGRKNLCVQADLFHMQNTTGNILHTLEKYLPFIRHIQVSGVPGRHEPDEQNELNFPFIFGELDRWKYQHWVGCEYNPRGSTLQGLGWLQPFL
eukprot:m.70085 g.70085  ORF g.70085 m.70085 type:complete len:179 (-) comp16816_c0_seq1:120-656(-)